MKNVNAAIDHLTAERGFSEKLATSLPKVQAEFLHWRKDGLSPEYCAALLAADVYTTFLTADLNAEQRKAIMREINHYSTKGSMPPSSPEFVTLKYIHLDMVLTRWTDQNLIPPSAALHARLEFTGKVVGLTKEQRRAMGDKIVANAANRA